MKGCAVDMAYSDDYDMPYDEWNRTKNPDRVKVNKEETQSKSEITEEGKGSTSKNHEAKTPPKSISATVDTNAAINKTDDLDKDEAQANDEHAQTILNDGDSEVSDEFNEGESSEVKDAGNVVKNQIARKLTKEAIKSMVSPVKGVALLALLFGSLSLSQFFSIVNSDESTSSKSNEIGDQVYYNYLNNDDLDLMKRDPKYLAFTMYADLRSSHITAEYVDEKLKSSDNAKTDWDNDKLSYSADSPVDQATYFNDWSAEEDNKIKNEITGNKEQTARRFQHEVVLGMFANMHGESGVNPLSFEGDYVVKAKTNDNMIFYGCHHTDWDTYFTALKTVYGSSTPINEDGYKYKKPLDDDKLNLHIDNDDTEDHYYPGLGLLGWTGPNAYKLQEFCNTFESPHEADQDMQNDAMYTIDGQFSFMLHDNTGTFKIRVPNDLKGEKYVEDANAKLYEEALAAEQPYQSWKGDNKGKEDREKLEQIRKDWEDKIKTDTKEISVPLVVWATYQKVNYKVRMFTYCNNNFESPEDFYSHEKAESPKNNLYYRIEMDTKGESENGIEILTCENDLEEDPTTGEMTMKDGNPVEAYYKWYPIYADEGKEKIEAGVHPGSCGCGPATGTKDDAYKFEESLNDDEYRVEKGKANDIRVEITVYDQFGQVMKSVDNGKGKFDGKSLENRSDMSVDHLAINSDATPGGGSLEIEDQRLVIEVGWSKDDIKDFWQCFDDSNWKIQHDCARYHYYMYDLTGDPLEKDKAEKCEKKAEEIAKETWQKKAKELNDDYIGRVCCGATDDEWKSKLEAIPYEKPEMSRFADWLSESDPSGWSTGLKDKRVYSAMGEASKVRAKEFLVGHQGMGAGTWDGAMLGTHIDTADWWAAEAHGYYHWPEIYGWNWRGNDKLAEGLCSVYCKEPEDGIEVGGKKQPSDWRMRDAIADFYTHDKNAYFDTSSPEDMAVALSYPKNFRDIAADVVSTALDVDNKYFKYYCTSIYIAVKDIVAPEDINILYSSCDRGLATIVRASGQDDFFPLKIDDTAGAGPNGTDLLGQLNYCLKWSKVEQDGIRWRRVYEDGRDYEGYVIVKDPLTGAITYDESKKTKPLGPPDPNEPDQKTQPFTEEKYFDVLQPGDIFIKSDGGVRHVVMFVGQEAVMQKWPHLYEYESDDKTKNCTRAVVHASHMGPDDNMTETDDARGLRCDPDGKFICSDGKYYVFRAATQNYESGRKRWAVEAKHNQLAILPKGDVKTGYYYDQIAGDLDYIM